MGGTRSSGSSRSVLGFHQTGAADRIREEGFSILRGETLGRGWGEGVYIALDENTRDVYASFLPGETLSVRADVKNPFTPNTLDTITGGGFQQVDAVRQALGVSPSEAQRILDRDGLAKALQSGGYDALIIPTPFNHQMIVFDPKKVRVI